MVSSPGTLVIIVIFRLQTNWSTRRRNTNQLPTKWILLSQNWLAIKQPQHQENNSNKEILHKLYPLSSYCSYTFLSNTATTTATTTRLHKEEKQQQQLHIQTSCFDFFFIILIIRLAQFGFFVYIFSFLPPCSAALHWF
jgi:hypothetical protein